MTDFMITSSGDLVFTESSKENKKLEISFYVSQTNTLKINFEVDTYQDEIPRNNSLQINFSYDDLAYNKKAMMVSNDACKMQQIMMRLKTSLGELAERPEIGSMVETVMHQNIKDKAVQSKIIQVIGEALSDILSNYSIKVIPHIDRTNGYNQVIKVLIYENNELVLVYDLEG